MERKEDGQRKLSAAETTELLKVIKARFEANANRHKGVDWADVEKRLKNRGAALWSLNEMERTGGEPDVIGGAGKGGEYVFFDCAAESPAGRRSICYDRAGLESRKENRPESTAVDMAAELGIELLTEEEYHHLQKLGEFDLKTSSWVETPPDIRKLGGAIFCDRRFGRVFTYHNGAQSYYAARGFRGRLKV